MKLILQYIKPYLWRMSGGFAIKFTATLVELFLPWVLAYLIDTVVPTENKGQIYLWGGVMVVCSLIAVIGNVTANRLAAGVARDTTRKLRQDLFDKTIQLTDAQVNEFTVPSLEARLTSDTYHIHHFVGMIQRLGVRAPILLIGGIALTFTMEPILTLVLVATLPIISFVVYWVSTHGVPLYRKLQETVDEMVRIVRENISGIRVIKALSRVPYERDRFEKTNEKVTRRETKAGIMMALTSPVMTVLLNVGLTLVIFIGAYRVNAGISEAGKIVAFMSYFTIILNAMMSVTRMFIMFSRSAASADRIDEVLRVPGESEVLQRVADDRVFAAAISFDKVSFAFEEGKDIVSDLTFSLPKGKTLGIIGATGSGKTTLLKLMMRFFDPQKGEIVIGGKNIKSYSLKELRQKFGVVMQNDFIYADSIAENIKFGREIAEDALLKAVSDAQAAAFVEETGNGLSHAVQAAGHNLSGGQRQRLLIARALAGDPEILVLDDASSALDYKTDAALRRAIEHRESVPTTVVVAQRVSSIMTADLILVMDDGQIVAQGTHQTLLEQCDIYREIADMQLGGVSIGG